MSGNNGHKDNLLAQGIFSREMQRQAQFKELRTKAYQLPVVKQEDKLQGNVVMIPIRDGYEIMIGVKIVYDAFKKDSDELNYYWLIESVLIRNKKKQDKSFRKVIPFNDVPESFRERMIKLHKEALQDCGRISTLEARHTEQSLCWAVECSDSDIEEIQKL